VQPFEFGALPLIMIGLTGSIAMGKTTVARMFADEGVPVFDSDAAVHELYRGAAVAPVEASFPNVTIEGRIDRVRLASRVMGDPAALRRLEAIVHPLVESARRKFISAQRLSARNMLVLDVPLLLETGGDAAVDLVVVVTAPADIQRARALSRSGMTGERFDEIMKRQMPDSEKRRRAHFLVDTSASLESTRQQVRDFVQAVSAMIHG
jgi:dephospho-CoA kinase